MNKDDEMHLLLKKIDKALSGSSDSNSVGILEGGIRNMESLLYDLKGAGAIGLFRSTDVETSSKKPALEDWVYFFDVDRKKFEEFKKKFPKKERVVFLEKESVLSINDINVELPPAKNEYDLCRILFEHPINQWIDWEEIYKSITGNSVPADYRKAKKMVSDTCARLNKRVKDKTGISNFVVWANKTLRRRL